MTLATVAGGYAVPVGIGSHFLGGSQPQQSQQTLSATKAAVIGIGQIITADGASHTIDTTGSSSIQWRTDSITFANAGTSVVVGLAAVDTANGPPGRAVNVADVITFDVSRTITGGGGGITSAAWQTHVPTAGTKTIANGDLLVFAVQMVTKGGADSVTVSGNPGTGNSTHLSTTTLYNGTTYATQNQSPMAIIVFSDGVLGWIYASDTFNSVNTRTFNSGSATKEYGQLYSLSFPYRIYGLYGWIDPDADCDIILYSDPLGTPVAEKTYSMDLNVVSAGSPRRFDLMFASTYDVAANTNIAAIFKPGASSMSAYYKTFSSATHRVTDAGGTSCYGVSRASGAFANANSSLDHYYIGLLIGAFDAGGAGSAGLQYRNLMGGNLV